MQALLTTAPPASGADTEKRNLILATCGLGAGGVLATAIPFVASMSPSERARSAGAPVEVDITGLAAGELRVVEWRGKPVWIFGRDAATLAALEGHRGELADPDSRADQQPGYARNAGRSIRPEVFVAVGICTHLGCSPVKTEAGAAGSAGLGADWKGGFFCPCHGSTFDLAGRVFKNKPAPTNLEVPPYRYLSDARIVIGEDGVA
jgi:ubiquinol-cytochrome c reductase iron-sulfur subunit